METKVCRACKHHSNVQVEPKNMILNAIYQFLWRGKDYCRKNAHTNPVTGIVMNGPCKTYRGYGAKCGVDGWQFEPKSAKE